MYLKAEQSIAADVMVNATKSNFRVTKPLSVSAGVQLKGGQSIAADLVVEASGGNSRVNKWLEQIGRPAPPSMVVDAGLQYICRMYEMTGDPKASTNLIMIMDRPAANRMAVRLPIEHNCL